MAGDRVLSSVRSETRSFGGCTAIGGKNSDGVGCRAVLSKTPVCGLVVRVAKHASFVFPTLSDTITWAHV